MHGSQTAGRQAALLVITCIFTLALGGCNSAHTSLPSVTNATTAQSALESAAADLASTTKPKLLFVGDNADSEIAVFNAVATAQNPAPLRTITAGIDAPEGMTVDRAGVLYVANSGDSAVTIYGPGKGTPRARIFDGLNQPMDVKVDGFGNVYVANNPFGHAPNIKEYAKGATTAEYTWTAPSGNMFITGIALLNPELAGGTSIYALEYVYNGGNAIGGILSCYPGNLTCTQGGTGYTLGETGGIAVEESPGEDKPFEYLVVDQYLPGVDVFQPAVQASPVGQIVTGNTPEMIALNGGRNRLFVAENVTGVGSVYEYTFPGGTRVNYFAPRRSDRSVTGVAVSPATTYF
jgi:hypothetical protein